MLTKVIFSTDSALIGQLKRVTLPVFSADKKMYQNWKAAFTAYIDKVSATAVFKLLYTRIPSWSGPMKAF